MTETETQGAVADTEPEHTAPAQGHLPDEGEGNGDENGAEATYVVLLMRELTLAPGREVIVWEQLGEASGRSRALAWEQAREAYPELAVTEPGQTVCAVLVSRRWWREITAVGKASVVEVEVSGL